MTEKEKWAIHWLAQDKDFAGVDEYHIKIFLAGFECFRKEVLKEDEHGVSLFSGTSIEELGNKNA